MTRKSKATPVAPATLAEAQATPVATVAPVAPVVTAIKPADIPLLKDTAEAQAHRNALVELLSDVAVTRNEAAILNAQAKEDYAKIDALTLAFHYASLAAELLRAYPQLAKSARLWGGMWGNQLAMIAAAIFEKGTAKDAAALKGRLGQDATRFGMAFHYVPTVIPEWVAKRYGVAPSGVATIAAAYAVAKVRKAQANPRNDAQIGKLWEATRKRLGSVAEVERFVSVAVREAKAEAEAEARKAAEADTPAVKTA